MTADEKLSEVLLVAMDAALEAGYDTLAEHLRKIAAAPRAAETLDVPQKTEISSAGRDALEAHLKVQE